MHNPEVISTHENTKNQSESAAERSLELSKSRENHQESGSERKGRIENARKAANHEAIASKDRPATERKSGGEPTLSASRSTKKHKAEAYRSTIGNIQADMNPAARVFSKVIHSPTVEKTADLVSSTIARPKSIIYGSFTALVVVSSLYMAAKYFGYPLSGFETIAAFLVGWLIGLSYEALTSLVRH